MPKAELEVEGKLFHFIFCLPVKSFHRKDPRNLVKGLHFPKIQKSPTYNGTKDDKIIMTMDPTKV